MKKIVFALLFITAFGLAKSQQISLHSQYMMNRFILFPAIAGTQNFVPVNLNVRKQWEGIDGAPITQTLSAHGYIGKNVGIGGSFFNDVTGPTRRTGMNVTFAYHLKLNEDFSNKLSFGLSGIFFQHFVDEDQLTTLEPDDQAIIHGFNNEFCPDAIFSVVWSSSGKYYVGASVHNLLEVRSDLLNSDYEISNPIERTYYANAGYIFDLGGDFKVEPSVLMQTQESTPMQFDFNARFGYKDKFWLGGSYRMNDAIVAMFALNFREFCFGYSYDITQSDIKNYSTGTHEINLTYRIFQKNGFNQNSSNIPLFN